MCLQNTFRCWVTESACLWPHVWICTKNEPNTTLWTRRRPRSTLIWWRNSSYNNCELTLFVFLTNVYFLIKLHIIWHHLSVSFSFTPLCLSGWRLCDWQLYKAHSHRRTRHNLLHPAAPEGAGGGHPAGAVTGDGQGSQGRSLHYISHQPLLLSLDTHLTLLWIK